MFCVFNNECRTLGNKALPPSCPVLSTLPISCLHHFYHKEEERRCMLWHAWSDLNWLLRSRRRRQMPRHEITLAAVPAKYLPKLEIFWSEWFRSEGSLSLPYSEWWLEPTPPKQCATIEEADGRASVWKYEKMYDTECVHKHETCWRI